MIRTRFAPSPTGFLHIGGARTALFSWAYAKKHNGTFILRIEDTDLERSTQESVDNIINALHWLGLDPDEGPYFQTKRLARYKAVIEEMLAKGIAYHCYCSREELDAMREIQRLAGEKPRYDGRCRHRPSLNKAGGMPVIRFKNPETGFVVWKDLVKGKIEIANRELDDLIIARSDGTPTYNFCVVVDDLDMKITHVTRGDDHVNNTPRQINILKALGADIPCYAHIPMILRSDGQKMSKRRDPVSVMQYQEMGLLPEALLNYLARLCFGHGDDEIFSMEQFVSWFDLKDISPSAARFDIKKLLWVNSMHIRACDNLQLSKLIKSRLESFKIDSQELDLFLILDLVKLRVDNLNSLVQEVKRFYQPELINAEDASKYITHNAKFILAKFADVLMGLMEWDLDALKLCIKTFCKEENIKLAELGMPLRLQLCGSTQTPSFDAILNILGKNKSLARINNLG